MAQALTTDNIDDIIRQTLRANFKDINYKLKTIAKLIRTDIALDKGQGDELPDSSSRLDSIYSKLDEIKTDFNLLREELKGFREQIQLLNEKLKEIEI